ncbi:hypothetical protein [Pseudonocardia acaciae]|uniref:hypothetical protein n=1 Tax=Pseudonocardia acaciae TaxID=551276 RepID=UPI00146FDE82|nr:hypothetical protein [Pseudonocardia acaciae]
MIVVTHQTSVHVFAVHAVHPRQIRGTDTVWTAEDDAEERASKVSTDPDVLAAAVTRFTLNTPGERHPAALYVDGVRQRLPHISDDRRVLANGLKGQLGR